MTSKNNGKKLWLFLFPVLAALAIWAVASYSRNFSWDTFKGYLSALSPPWFWAAICCMLGYILSEGFSLRFICGRLGFRATPSQAALWAGADLFFSAITPSATGGQPAAAALMLKNKVPGSTCSVALLLNIMLYTLTIVLLSPWLLFFGLTGQLDFSMPSWVMIVLGLFFQTALALFFLILLGKPVFLWRALRGILRLLHRLHLLRDLEKWMDRLDRAIPAYEACAQTVRKDRVLLLGALGLNLCQRLCFLLVPVCIFLGTGGQPSLALHSLMVQAGVVLGSDAAPLPGAMGVADLLFLDGYAKLTADPVSMVLLSRGISFYGCILVCGLLVLLSRILHFKRR